ncbi:VOC family protein [Pandoraea apista]|uniref:VOC family protein n=1 Tax=Pandoraea apista TaxID=93218 RepID=UPI000659C66B|nr:VOC family protein [Pandoraea apista]ALS65110.1 glyoxalase [Pandoraea apista]RRW92348.1 glyoxalase [Pandoraea apista]RRX01814.1 glyoxalase [Pandoraea apista]CFB65462.1 Manganese-dependent 2,3-dihydroxybiphenyl 1,2-dioxygenase [Pandoraea apista]
MTRPRPRRLGHLVMMVRDLKASARFYVDIVGLEVSDRIGDQMVFLRCGEEHHDLALAQLPADSPKFDDGPDTRRPGLEHFAYQLANLDEIERAAAFLKAKGVEIVRGIGKHGPGENVFLVFKDPDGNYVEFYCDMIQMNAATPHVPRTWENNLDAFDQWHFQRFLVPPPAWGPRTGDGDDNHNN